MFRKGLFLCSMAGLISCTAEETAQLNQLGSDLIAEINLRCGEQDCMGGGEVATSAVGDEGYEHSDWDDRVQAWFYLVTQPPSSMTAWPDSIDDNAPKASGRPTGAMAQINALLSHFSKFAVNSGLNSCSLVPDGSQENPVSLQTTYLGQAFNLSFISTDKSVPSGYPSQEQKFDRAFRLSIGDTTVAQVHFICGKSTLYANVINILSLDLSNTQDISTSIANVARFEIYYEASDNGTHADFIMFNNNEGNPDRGLFSFRYDKSTSKFSLSGTNVSNYGAESGLRFFVHGNQEGKAHVRAGLFDSDLDTNSETGNDNLQDSCLTYVAPWNSTPEQNNDSCTEAELNANDLASQFAENSPFIPVSSERGVSDGSISSIKGIEADTLSPLE